MTIKEYKEYLEKIRKSNESYDYDLSKYIFYGPKMSGHADNIVGTIKKFGDRYCHICLSFKKDGLLEVYYLNSDRLEDGHYYSRSFKLGKIPKTYYGIAKELKKVYENTIW